MRVNHRRGHILVPEELLHRADIVPIRAPAFGITDRDLEVAEIHIFDSKPLCREKEAR